MVLGVVCSCCFFILILKIFIHSIRFHDAVFKYDLFLLSSSLFFPIFLYTLVPLYFQGLLKSSSQSYIISVFFPLPQHMFPSQGLLSRYMTYTHNCTYTHTQIPTHICTNVHTYICTCVHACMHVCECTSMCGMSVFIRDVSYKHLTLTTKRIV